MSIKTRGLVFATFFGSCLVVGVLVASLSTNYWIQSTVKHKGNATNSKGHVNFGLFNGFKNLDVGYGVRPVQIDGE